MERFEPREGTRVKHLGIGTGCTVAEETDGEVSGKYQQGRAARNHHATHLIDVTREPKAEQHQQGDEYE